MHPVLLSAAIGLLLSVGWFGRGYWDNLRDKAAERDELIEQTEKMAENLGILAIVNAAVVDSQHELVEKQNATNKAIEGVKHAIKTKPIGGCSLTPDADKLRQQTYNATAGAVSK